MNRKKTLGTILKIHPKINIKKYNGPITLGRNQFIQDFYDIFDMSPQDAAMLLPYEGNKLRKL